MTQKKPKIKFRLTVGGKTLPYETKEEFLLAVWAALTDKKEEKANEVVRN